MQWKRCLNKSVPVNNNCQSIFVCKWNTPFEFWRKNMECLCYRNDEKKITFLRYSNSHWCFKLQKGEQSFPRIDCLFSLNMNSLFIWRDKIFISQFQNWWCVKDRERFDAVLCQTSISPHAPQTISKLHATKESFMSFSNMTCFQLQCERLVRNRLRNETVETKKINPDGKFIESSTKQDFLLRINATHRPNTHLSNRTETISILSPPSGNTIKIFFLLWTLPSADERSIHSRGERNFFLQRSQVSARWRRIK